MRPDATEQLFIEELFKNSQKKLNIDCGNNSSLVQLTGDASTRRYYRISCENHKSFVVCLADPVEEGEFPTFYKIQSIFKENNICVPEIYDLSSPKGYFLEQDLGDETLLNRLAVLRSSQDELEIYKKALDELIKIHKINSRNEVIQREINLRFDFEKLYYEIEFTHEYLIEKLLNYTFSEEELKIIQISFKDICKKLSESEMVVTHRDFHSRNIMIVDDSLYVIDFQDARMGIPQYDLVSLLEDCYYSIEIENKQYLKKYYWDNFYSLYFTNTSFEEFLYLYDLMTVQRVYKALGSFSYIFNLRQDIRYLKYIGHGFEKIRKILSKYEEFQELKVTLSKGYYVN